MTPQLLSLLDRLGEPRLLVLGDFLLDRYTWGDAERISPEAPVLVLRADRREARPGGAGSVCAMLRGLGAEVVAVGAVGDDAEGTELVRLLADEGVETAAIVRRSGRVTSVKERFIGRAAHRHAHQILRVDREERMPLTPAIEAELIKSIGASLARCHALLISDYDKGVCTPGLLTAVIAQARAAGAAVLVDPARGVDYTRYRGAALVTPNRLEAELATGKTIEKPEDALPLGEELCRRGELDAAVITLDRDGMALVQVRGEPHAGVYPTQVRNVYDITGAGDMVLAMLGVAVAGGGSLVEAVRLANVAAGLKVEKFGAAPVSRDEVRLALLRSPAATGGKRVSLATVARLAESHRRLGERIVFTNGCFDLLHVGHVKYLEEAAALGDVLVVGLNSDRSVRALKGEGRPVIDESSRASLLAALACVDYVLVFDEATPHELLRQIKPDVLVKGGTYTPEEVVGREIVESYGGRVCVTGMTEGVSTTAIVESLRAK
jgi:D-beta-D-heptose 7-phosphate kinase/D-beta-D-heptose 1-phosphate adenosyltransferase